MKRRSHGRWVRTPTSTVPETRRGCLGSGPVRLPPHVGMPKIRTAADVKRVVLDKTRKGEEAEAVQLLQQLAQDRSLQLFGRALPKKEDPLCRTPLILANCVLGYYGRLEPVPTRVSGLRPVRVQQPIGLLGS